MIFFPVKSISVWGTLPRCDFEGIGRGRVGSTIVDLYDGGTGDENSPSSEVVVDIKRRGFVLRMTVEERKSSFELNISIFCLPSALSDSLSEEREERRRLPSGIQPALSRGILFG